MTPLDFGDLKKLKPISREFGFDRGTPVDRYYINRFLNAHRPDITGHVLEIGDDAYAREFGDVGVTMRDVLHIQPNNKKATIIADLADGKGIPSDTFDCAIITQTLHLIYEPENALATLFRILRENGVLLLTVPGISPVSCDQWGASWYWSFTKRSLERMFRKQPGWESVEIGVSGNLYAATSFLAGIAVEEVAMDRLDTFDPEYALIYSVRAKKRARR